MRKRLCAYLALLLLGGLLTVPAQASGRYSTTIDAVCQLPEMKVTVPATGNVFINPYRIPVEINATQTSAQVVTVPAAIENESIVPIDVSVTVRGTTAAGSDMLLTTNVAKMSNNRETRKLAFLYFEMHAVSDPDQAAWDSAFDDEKHLAVSDVAPRLKSYIATLAAGGQPDRYGAFRITGLCIQRPKNPWTENDKMDVAIAFTFTPHA